MTAMLEYRAIVVVTAAVLSVGCTNAVEELQFRITSKRDNDKVEIKAEQDITTVSVHSPFGISHAILEQANKNWPDTMLLRLHLQGLENFKVTNGAVTLEAAVSSQDGKVRLWMDGKEDSPLDVKSPYWMEIRMVGDDGEPATAIPLMDGCFEIQLPKSLLEDNPKSITVNWIDFYR